jgi:hypothetical protein
MGFYWKDGKDQLLARSGTLPPTDFAPEPSTTGNPWTSFTMDLREPSILEGPLDLARFFVTSLTFMRTMKKIDMLVDDVRVLRISKEVHQKTRVSKRGMKTSSTNGMMSITGVDATGMTITAEVMQWLAGMSLHVKEGTDDSHWLCPTSNAHTGCDNQRRLQTFRFLLYILIIQSISTYTYADPTSTACTDRRSDGNHQSNKRDSYLSSGNQSNSLSGIRPRARAGYQETSTKDHACQLGILAKGGGRGGREWILRI